MLGPRKAKAWLASRTAWTPKVGSGKGFDGPRGRLSVESSEEEGEGGCYKECRDVFFPFRRENKTCLGKTSEGGGALFLGHDAIQGIHVPEGEGGL